MMRFIYLPTLRHASRCSIATTLWSASYLSVKETSASCTSSPGRQSTDTTQTSPRLHTPCNEATISDSVLPPGQKSSDTPSRLQYDCNEASITGSVLCLEHKSTDTPGTSFGRQAACSEASIMDSIRPPEQQSAEAPETSLRLQAAFSEAQQRVQKLDILDSAKKEISRYIESVNVIVEDWFATHKCQYSGDFHEDWIEHIRWSWKGTIDKQKTAESLVANCATLTSKARYRLACAYCLEDYISKKLKDEKEQRATNSVATAHSEIMAFWLDEWEFLISDIECRDAFVTFTNLNPASNHRAWLRAAICGNEIALGYFIREMRSSGEETEFCRIVERRMQWLQSMASHNRPVSNSISIVGLILNNVSDATQMEVFRSFPFAMRIFGAWPWNYYLLEVFGYVQCMHLRVYGERNSLVDYSYRTNDGVNPILDNELRLVSTRTRYRRSSEEGFLPSHAHTFLSLMDMRCTLYATERECRNLLRKFWHKWGCFEKLTWLRYQFEADLPSILRSSYAGNVLRRIYYDDLVKPIVLPLRKGCEAVLNAFVAHRKWDLVLDFIKVNKCSGRTIEAINRIYRDLFRISVHGYTPEITVNTEVTNVDNFNAECRSSGSSFARKRSYFDMANDCAETSESKKVLFLPYR